MTNRRAWRRAVVLLTATLILLVLVPFARADVKLKQLRVGGEVYRNVTVTGSNDTDAFLTHSRGMANVKLKNLDPETLWRMGLGPKPGSPEALAAVAAAAKAEKKSSGLFARWFGSSNKDAAPEPRAEPAAQPHQVPAGSSAFDINPIQPVEDWLKATAKGGSGLLAILGVLLLAYWFTCYCLKRIVEKAGYQPGFGIWIPILNYLHALRGARMSGAWLAVPFLMSIVGNITLAGALGARPGAALWTKTSIFLLGSAGLIALIGQLIWCVRIVSARGKGLWVSIFLLVAVLCPFAAPLALISEQLFRVCWLGANALGVFAVLYLAFSSGDGGAKEDGSHEKLVMSPVLLEA